MSNVILCVKDFPVEAILERYKKQYPNMAFIVNVCQTEEQLIAMLEHARREKSAGAEQRFAIKTQDGVRIVAASEILYCRCESHRYAAVLVSGEEIMSRSFRRAFPQVLAPLLESGMFIQCQASYIVNLRYIRAVGEKQLELQNGAKLPFPLSRQERVRDKLGFAPRV